MLQRVPESHLVVEQATCSQHFASTDEEVDGFCRQVR